MIKVLHFSDAHIDLALHGKRDPATGLTYRILDFLKALDTIIDTAISIPVDLVIFAGDAYRDRSPAPTYQKEWGKRIMRLSQAGIPTILLVGNHDLSPAFGRAHALQEYETFSIANIHVIDRPKMLMPQDLDHLPVQILAIPWISRSAYLAQKTETELDKEKVNTQIEDLITDLAKKMIDEADPHLPLILTAHASVQGAMYGGERSIMLGNDYTLPGSLVRDIRLDYVALGHIHKSQDLNDGFQPPVIYPGSIERVDFGEYGDQKHFVIANVEKGKTEVHWIPLIGRRFKDDVIDLRNLMEEIDEDKSPTHEDVMNYLREYVPIQADIEDAVARLTVIYPRDWESLLDSAWLHKYYEPALEAIIIQKPIANVRMRLGDSEEINELDPLQLLDKYLLDSKVPQEEAVILKDLASKIIYNQEDRYDKEAGP